MNHDYQKDIAGCGVSGIINKKKNMISGDVIKKSICVMNDRGNGLGSGFAAYGIYPEMKDLYALHVMCIKESSIDYVDEYISRNFHLAKKEEMPTYKVKGMEDTPFLYRYFVEPSRKHPDRDLIELSNDDFVVASVMDINKKSGGGYVFSSGKNMGVFKGVGLPGEIADFFRIQDYEGYSWTAHNRFPTNTPGWWGGAHPFTLLDWSIVHNGEISSYGINKRYLEMFGYHLSLMTDTEVVAYLLDLFVRRQGLSIEIACTALASPFWRDIEREAPERRELLRAIRQVYGSGLLNGPFAFILGHSRGLVGLNDRVKLRPLVTAVKGDVEYMASEEAAIREICPAPDRVWSPKAGAPVVIWFDDVEEIC